MEQCELLDGISVCLIAKNEEENIKAAISSVKSISTELIVVDTGSTDNTIEIVKGCGAKVFSFEWNDNFAAVRNFAISKATCKWIFFIDADEVVSSCDCNKIVDATFDESSDAYVLIQRNYCNSPEAEGWVLNDTSYEEGKDYRGFFDVPIVRLFRNVPEIFFDGLVHEVVDDSLKNFKKRYLDVPIHHFSYFGDDLRRQNKSFFYLSLLQKQYEQDPNDSRTLFLLGRQYYTLGEYEAAIKCLEIVVVNGSKCEMAYDNLAMSYIQKGIFDKAKTVLDVLMKLNPKYTQAYTTVGIVYYELGEVQTAFEYLTKAIKAMPHSFSAYFNLAATFYREKKYKEALPVIEKAIFIMPNNARAYYLKFYILFNLNEINRAFDCANFLSDLDSHLYEVATKKLNEFATACNKVQEDVL